MQLSKEDSDRLIRHMREDPPNQLVIKALESGRRIRANDGRITLGELNPPTDTLSTNSTDGWIDEGGSISEEIKIIEQRLLTPTQTCV